MAYGRMALKCGGAAVVGASGVGGFYLYRRHQHALVPRNTQYNVPAANWVPSRASSLNRLTKENFDIIVIGGGATGAGTALDAATRGLKCALLEADDFASGTSSRSTKLLHGGVRYLEAAFKNLDAEQLHLVCEALEERAHLMKCAPYMSKPVPIVMPLYQLWQVPYCWIGIKVYDWLARLVTWFDTGLPNCFFASRGNACVFFPQLKAKGLKGSLVYYDGQHNDARMNLAIAMTSAIPNYIDKMEPATIANHCRVVGILKDEHGRAIGVRARDTTNDEGEDFNVYGKVVVNCTGPAADVIRRMDNPKCAPLVDTAAGTHIVLPKFYTPFDFGLIIPKTSDGRVAFLLPWEGHTVAGTTDVKADLTDLPQATAQDVDYLVEELSSCLKSDPEQLRKDVRATWAGLRPLVKAADAADSSNTSKLSRTHRVVEEETSGVISVVGGKWTTYRRMAQDTLDYVLARHAGAIVPRTKCRTKQLKLFPAVNPVDGTTENASEVLPRQLQTQYNLRDDQAVHLARNYGYQAFDVCRLGKEENLLEPLVEPLPFLQAEVLFSVRHEMAQTCTDVLGRRLRVSFLDSSLAWKASRQVLEVLTKELQWNPQRQAAEAKAIEAYLGTMSSSPGTATPQSVQLGAV